MKSINLGAAILGGVICTVAMTALMYAAPLMGLPPMDLLLALGSLLPIGASPYLVGGLMHLATGVILALLYAVVFERILPGPRWIRGATFSLLPWLFAVTLMAPAMAWLQGAIGHAEAGTVVGSASTSVPAEPNGVASTPRMMNPCAVPAKPTNPCGAAAPRPANPCAAVSASAEPTNPWLVRMMSLMAHLVYGGVVALVYQRKG